MCREIGLHINRNYQRQFHICRRLESLGLSVHKASTIDIARKMVQKHCYRLVMMDFDTMGEGILDFCQLIRSGSPYTIIVAMTSKIKMSIEEKLFDSGVNDVVAGKQISSRILAKRIRAHLRHSSKPSLEQSNKIRLKDVVVDFNRNEVWCNGTVHRLRGIQQDLLKYFLNNPGRIISRDELLASPIWNDSICSPAVEGGRTFDVNMGKLRKIIEHNPKNPQIIVSVRSKGWMLDKDVLL